MDIRDDSAQVTRLKSKGVTVITKDEGLKLKQDIKAYKYLECSALTQENVSTVFEECARCVLNGGKEPEPEHRPTTKTKNPTPTPTPEPAARGSRCILQ